MRTASNKQTARRSWRRPALIGVGALAGAGLMANAFLPLGQDAVAQTERSQAKLTKAFFGPNSPTSFSGLVEKVRPAVVSIVVKNGRTKKPRMGNPFRNNPDSDEFFEWFKRYFGERGGSARPGAPERRNRPVRAQGSGFIISGDGYVVTNHHVVADSNEIALILDSGKKYVAKLIGSDKRTDIALLKIDTKERLPHIKLSEKGAKVGDWVLAVGNPFGLGGTVTAGIISAQNRAIGSGPHDFLQIDAAVNRGNSGGPAVNLEGEVVGVNTAIYSPTGGNVGIAFAIPAKLVAEIVDELKRTGTVSRGFLGVRIQPVSEDIASSLGLDKPRGAMIADVTAGGPSDGTDLKVGDVIVKVNGESISDVRDLQRKIAALPPKAPADITVFRGGNEVMAKVTLGSFNEATKVATKAPEKGPGAKVERMDALGLSLAPADQYSDGAAGVVITRIDPSGLAAEKGLSRGDIILQIDSQTVSSPEDVMTRIKSARTSGKKAVLLQVKKRDRTIFIGLPIEKV